jgi:hypothetical protein
MVARGRERQRPLQVSGRLRIAAASRVLEVTLAIGGPLILSTCERWSRLLRIAVVSTSSPARSLDRRLKGDVCPICRLDRLIDIRPLWPERSACPGA